MARVRKPQPTLDSLFFSTPEQKVIRFLLSEPTTAFTPRVISSKLKGVRGLGGADGITRILSEFQQLGLVDFVDNYRAVRVRDDNSVIKIMKTFTAVCDMEGLKILLEPHSSKGVLYGARAIGETNSDSSYELFVVSETPEEVKKTASRHPLGRKIELVVRTSEEYGELTDSDERLAEQIAQGIVLWGSPW